jgi:hypothetical protein
VREPLVLRLRQAAPAQPSHSERIWIWCDLLLLKKCISCQFDGTFQMVDFPLFVVNLDHCQKYVLSYIASCKKYGGAFLMQFGQIAYAIKQTIKPSTEDTAKEAEDKERAKQIRKANRSTQSSPKAVLDLTQMQAVQDPQKSQGAQGAGHKQLIQDHVVIKSTDDLQMQAVKGPQNSQGAQGAGHKHLFQDPVVTETSQQNQTSTENPSR